MSPPATPGVPERFTTPGVHQSIHALDARVARVEGHTTELVRDMSDVKAYLGNVKALENVVRHIVGKGILLIVGAVGSTWGVTRATQDQHQERTVITKSATSAKVEACTSMQPGPDRDQCAIRILTELMGPQR